MRRKKENTTKRLNVFSVFLSSKIRLFKIDVNLLFFLSQYIMYTFLLFFLSLIVSTVYGIFCAIVQVVL